MKLFKNASKMLTETGLMRSDERYRREDRATVAAFFNGQPPMSDAEAEALGLQVNVNHLFGYTELRRQRDQLVALYNKTTSQLEIDLDSAPPGKRIEWSMRATTAANEVAAAYRPFKSEYTGVAGDAALHGEAVFFYGNRTFPLPRQVPLSRLLIPSSSSTNTAELTHFAIEDTLQASFLSAAIRHEYRGWKKEAVRKALAELFKDSLQTGTDQDNAEEMEMRAQENSALPERGRGIPVTYFFQQNPDEDGPPWDLTIIRKYPADSGPKDGETNDAILFEKERMYPRVQSIIHPFFMDCIIGGAPRWHRVLGTGTLNYQLNIATELLLSRMMQSTSEAAMNMWMVKDGATREEISRVLMKHNGVIPENMELVQNRFAPNFAGMLDMVTYFRAQGSRNARGNSTNSGSGTDKLEVQELADQQQAAGDTSMAVGEWHSYYDGLMQEYVCRLTNPLIDARDPGYSMVRDFQDRMMRYGIPLYWLQEHNVRVRARRIVGDGLRGKEMVAATILTNNRQFFPPEKQPEVTRLIVALGTDDHRLAEDLIPIEQKPDTSQIFLAQTENTVLANEPISRNESDIDEVHIPVHFKGLETLIKDGMQSPQSAFTPKQAESFRNTGAHLLVHIQTIEEKAEPNKNDQNRQLARAFTDQLTQYAALGDKLFANMQQQQEGEQQEAMSEAEKAKLQLAMQQLQLSQEKLMFSKEKFQRTQGTREQNVAFDQMLKIEQGNREGARLAAERQDAKHAQAMNEVAAATKIAQANKPKSESK